MEDGTCVMTNFILENCERVSEAEFEAWGGMGSGLLYHGSARCALNRDTFCPDSCVDVSCCF